jgi:hypothetical protein
MKDNHEDDTKNRKERVIHARVPEDLDEEIRRKANGLGVSVSNLVRNILQNTFGLVEDIVADSSRLARAARGDASVPEATAKQPEAAPRLLGWQEAALAVNAVCERCNALLPKGTQAAIGITDRPGKPQFLCTSCFKEETGR